MRGPDRRRPDRSGSSGTHLRRKLIDAEAVRVLARKGRTLITENALGLVQAAAGVDGSNVDAGELALLPIDPDGSAAALRIGAARPARRHRRRVVTDTMGRAWRNGADRRRDRCGGPDGAARLRGSQDRHGNELIVTEIAVADEIAAAADLVKGKLTDIPVAVVRGLSLPDNGSNARDLLRPGEEDLFWLGTEEAIALGRSQAQLLRRSVRAVHRRARRTRAHRGRRRRSADRAGATPHPAGAVRVGAGPRDGGSAARPDEGRSGAPT